MVATAEVIARLTADDSQAQAVGQRFDQTLKNLGTSAGNTGRDFEDKLNVPMWRNVAGTEQLEHRHVSARHAIGMLSGAVGGGGRMMMEMYYSVQMLGAGLGGLTAGIFLAKTAFDAWEEGKKQAIETAHELIRVHRQIDEEWRLAPSGSGIEHDLETKLRSMEERATALRDKARSPGFSGALGEAFTFRTGSKGRERVGQREQAAEYQEAAFDVQFYRESAVGKQLRAEELEQEQAICELKKKTIDLDTAALRPGMEARKVHQDRIGLAEDGVRLAEKDLQIASDRRKFFEPFKDTQGVAYQASLKEERDASLAASKAREALQRTSNDADKSRLDADDRSLRTWNEIAGFQHGSAVEAVRNKELDHAQAIRRLKKEGDTFGLEMEDKRYAAQMERLAKETDYKLTEYQGHIGFSGGAEAWDAMAEAANNQSPIQAENTAALREASTILHELVTALHAGKGGVIGLGHP